MATSNRFNSKTNWASARNVGVAQNVSGMSNFNPLLPSINIQILLICPKAFLTVLQYRLNILQHWHAVNVRCWRVKWARKRRANEFALRNNVATPFWCYRDHVWPRTHLPVSANASTFSRDHQRFYLLKWTLETQLTTLTAENLVPVNKGQ